MKADSKHDSGSDRRNDRWENLYETSHWLSEALSARETSGNEKELVSEVLRYLQSLQEVFPSSLDPIADFEGFSVREFVKAMEHAFASLAHRTPKDNSLPASPPTTLNP